MRSLLMILLMMMISLTFEVLAVPLIGIECPPEVYAHEIFSCKVLLTSTEGGEATFTLKGEKPLVVTGNLNTVLRPGTVVEKEINLWAEDVGRGRVFVYGKDCGAFADVELVNPPLSVVVDKTELEPGKENKLEVFLVGNAHAVSVWVEGPSTFSFDGKRVVGEVEGRKSIVIEVTVPPYAFGEHVLDVYVSFADSRGIHVLKYPVRINISFPVWVLGLLVAIVLLAYLLYRRKKGKEGKR